MAIRQEERKQKVKVYNLRDYFIKNHGKQTFSQDKIMIMEGATGVVIRDYEGVGCDENIITDSIRVGLNDYAADENLVYFFPQYCYAIPLKEIVDNADCEEMLLKEFMHKWDYNQRCENNFHITLNSLIDAGIDINQYI